MTSGGEALEVFYEKRGAKILFGLGFNLQMLSKITLALPLFLNFGYPFELLFCTFHFLCSCPGNYMVMPYMCLTS